MKRALFIVLAIALTGIFTHSCKKENIENPSPPADQADQQELLLMDSTYLFTYLFSLWNKPYLPEPTKNSDLRTFTSKHKNAEEVLAALMAMTPKIGPNNNPVDRFSFIDRTNRVGEEIGQGVHRDLGLSLQAVLFNQTTREVGIVIRLTQKNSPATLSGLKRGMRILSVDGEPLKFTLSSTNTVEGNMNAVNKLYTGTVSKIGVRDLKTATETNIDIKATSAYTLDPILENKVITLADANKKVGYLAYTSFVSVISNQQPNKFHRELTTAVDVLSGAGIQELVVDLRYNGGGETNAAQLLTNLLIPSGHNGKIMYTYVMNDVLTENGYTDKEKANAPFKPIYINKTNSLNLKRIYFLVTSSTASASELVINALKPYMDVQIISTSNRGTYGKPVGSFGRIVNNDTRLYITSFKMANAAGEGDYFNGLIGTKSNSSDSYTEALGTEREQMLSDALYHIANGSYRSNVTQARATQDNISLSRFVTIEAPLDRQVQGLYKLD